MFAGFDEMDVRLGNATIHARVGGAGAPLLLLHGYPQTLLVGLVLFNALPVDHGRRFAAKGGVRALPVVKIHPFSDTVPGLGAGFPGVQINALQ